MRPVVRPVGPLLLFAMVLCLAIGQLALAASDYPVKPITWIVPFGPGGASDRFARSLAEAARTVDPKVRFVVVNIPGAQTIAGLTHLLQQPADGYTIYGATTDVAFNTATGRTQISIDDVLPVVRIQQDVDMLFVRTSDYRFKTLTDLVSYAKTKPNQVTIATTGADGADAYSIGVIEEHYGIKFRIVPFDKPGERYAALVGGIVDVLFEQPGDMRGFIEAKQVKPVLSIAEQALLGFEAVPATGELGIPVTRGYWRGVVMRQGTPEPVVKYLEELFSQAIKTEKYRQYEAGAYLNLREGFLGGQDFVEFVRQEYNDFAELGGKK